MWSCWSQDVNTLGCAKSISLTGINWCLVFLKPIFRCEKVPMLYRKYTSEIMCTSHNLNGHCRVPCARLPWLCCLHWTSWVETSWVLTQSLFVSCNFSITAETWDVWGSRCCSYVSRVCTSWPPKTGSVWKFRVLVYARIALWTCIFQGRLRWPLLMEGLSYLWTGKW